MSQIKNKFLAKKGKLAYQWAYDHMGILTGIINQNKKRKPLQGITLGFCLQLTKETAVLLMGAKELGAKVVACSGNPLTTQDDIAAFLASRGITVYGWSNQTQKEFNWCIDQVLQKKPDIITDDGAELSLRAHFDKRFQKLKILGGTEETTTGVNRIKSLENKNKLRFPIILVNNARTKNLFDNRYGTGQSTIDGFLQAMNLIFASKRVVIAGYGWVGKGVAARCSGMGAKVIVTEIDPIKALEAHMDGFDVMPMNQASKIGDIFITCTGMTSVITESHFKKMKDDAILGNVGHFDVEIDAEFLLKQSVKKVRNNLDQCTLKNGKKLFLLSKGRVANLIATEGHPPEVMDQSFSNQLLSILYILKNYKKMKNSVYSVPKHLDDKVAKDALKTNNVTLDRLNQKQKQYMNSW